MCLLSLSLLSFLSLSLVSFESLLSFVGAVSTARFKKLRRISYLILQSFPMQKSSSENCSKKSLFPQSFSWVLLVFTRYHCCSFLGFSVTSSLQEDRHTPKTIYLLLYIYYNIFYNGYLPLATTHWNTSQHTAILLVTPLSQEDRQSWLWASVSSSYMCTVNTDPLWGSVFTLRIYIHCIHVYSE